MNHDYNPHKLRYNPIIMVVCPLKWDMNGPFYGILTMNFDLNGIIVKWDYDICSNKLDFHGL
jgi:hypothetical protein